MLQLFIVFGFSAFYSQHEEKSFLGWMRNTKNFFVGDEYHLRLGIFTQNMRYASEFNKDSTFSIGSNCLAHLTPSEYKTMLGHISNGKPKLEGTSAELTLTDVPDSIDYRNKGVVNPVKDQGQCGSCWAFGSVQAQESQWALKHNILYSLSESNLVDCVVDCFGCSGGNVKWAYGYIHYLQGGHFMLESDYPYTPKKGKCQFDKTKAVTQLHGYNTVKNDENELKIAVAQNGPYAIAIDASHSSFQLYTNGIYNEKSCSSSSLDHAVGLVGYGVDNGVDFWLVRNSWSTGWGEAGYVRIIRNAGNRCGVASDSVQPKIN